MIAIWILLLKSLITNGIIYLFIKKSKDRELLEIAKDVILFKTNEGHTLPKSIVIIRRYWIGKLITSIFIFIGIYVLLISFITVKAIVSILAWITRLAI